METGTEPGAKADTAKDAAGRTKDGATKGDAPSQTNGKGTAAAKAAAARKRPEHLMEVRKLLHRNLDALMDEHLPKLEQALANTAKSCSLTMTASMRTRKDLDLELTVTGKATLPHVGDTVRMRLEGDEQQLTLL